jgi:Na+/melibiose symporter-like transporter
MKTTSSHFLESPHTKLGWWSIGLIVAMPLLFFIGTSFTNSLYASVPAGNTILGDITARPALALTMLAGLAAGILSFITGLMAIVSQKERTLFVYIATVVGALLILFLAGEFIFPH